jgi:lipopolysaccharide transport system permease protein
MKIVRFLLAPFLLFHRHGALLWELVKREVLGRYRGASFGMLWSFLSPFLMLGVYTLAFGYVLKSRWPHASSPSDFALLLYIGLITHGFFAECLNRAPSLVVGNPNYVKKVIFPLNLMVWSLLGGTFFQLLVNTLVLAVLMLALHGSVPLTFVLLPVVLLPLALAAAGVVWLLAALGVYLRDIGQVMPVITTALMFLSSAIVPLQNLPQEIRRWFMLNPLTFIIDQARAVAYWGQLPDWRGFGEYALGALAALYLGYAVFNKLKRGFADVL